MKSMVLTYREVRSVTTIRLLRSTSRFSKT